MRSGRAQYFFILKVTIQPNGIQAIPSEPLLTILNAQKQSQMTNFTFEAAKIASVIFYFKS